MSEAFFDVTIITLTIRFYKYVGRFFIIWELIRRYHYAAGYIVLRNFALFKVEHFDFIIDNRNRSYAERNVLSRLRI
jgi:hypothetical protein